MSIVRGVNRRNAVEQPHRQPDPQPNKSTRPSHTPSQGQWDQMLQEMKSLMKENTRLKHQNLQLKEQLMLAKIELENTRLHNQQHIIKLQERIPPQKSFRKKSQGKTTQASQRILKIDESTNTLLKFESEDFTTVASSLKGKENEFHQWSSKENVAIPQSISFRDKDYRTPSSYSIQMRKKSTSISTKMTKKDQILNKYRKFMEHSDSENDFPLKQLQQC